MAGRSIGAAVAAILLSSGCSPQPQDVILLCKGATVSSDNLLSDKTTPIERTYQEILLLEVGAKYFQFWRSNDRAFQNNCTGPFCKWTETPSGPTYTADNWTGGKKIGSEEGRLDRFTGQLVVTSYQDAGFASATEDTTAHCEPTDDPRTAQKRF